MARGPRAETPLPPEVVQSLAETRERVRRAINPPLTQEQQHHHMLGSLLGLVIGALMIGAEERLAHRRMRH
ncbi:MAG: hypothetical protein KGJ07_03170 [Patescibacteria group bacterium]|nr:hypothetical protein [Patescibacteria group bacterium]MDE2588149.1 hypothetical protein [Patescibacteria group bacterium]